MNEINSLIESLESSTKRAQETFLGYSEEQFNWKPAPDKWSAAECIDHLVVSNSTYYPQFEEITQDKHKNSFWQSISPFSGFFGNFLVKAVNPENTKKVKTAKIFYPSNSKIPKKIIDDLAECNQKLIAYFKKMENLDLKKIKLSSPVSSFITYSLENTLKLLTQHEVRHINQAERVTHAEGFPKN